MPKVRTTLSLDGDLVERYQAVAAREGNSLSKVVNGWLGQVVEAAEYTASVVDQDREASAERLRLVIASLRMADDVLLDAVTTARRAVAARPAARPRPGATAPPRPVIRGGNSPTQPPKKGARRHG